MRRPFDDADEDWTPPIGATGKQDKSKQNKGGKDRSQKGKPGRRAFKPKQKRKEKSRRRRSRRRRRMRRRRRRSVQPWTKLSLIRNAFGLYPTDNGHVT